MSVLRRDPTIGRWVVYSDAPPVRLNADPCPFCEGHESRTPPEVRAWGRDTGGANAPGWKVRVVPNARPLLRIEAPLERHAEGMYDAASGTGAHEIVIEAPQHVASLAALPRPQMTLVLHAWAERIADLKRDARFRSIFIFKNQGFRAGAGMPGHVHSQVIGLPVAPRALKALLVGARDYWKAKERCVYCDVIAEDLEDGRRVVLASERFVAIAPYASRHPFECWILPRAHAADFEKAAPEDLDDLAGLLPAVLERLERALPEPAYNLFLYSGPNRAADPKRWPTLAQDFHWHIQILPRLTEVAGFETGSGFYANPVLPEKAAAVLRDGG